MTPVKLQAATWILIGTVRVLQVATALVVLGLSAYIVQWFNQETLSASPSQINFLIFAPIWSIISIVYLVLSMSFASISNPYASIFFEASNLVFYLAGAAGLGHYLSRLLFCRGIVCTVAKADVGITTVSFFLWLITLIILVADVFKVGFRKTQSVQARNPNMSAV